MSDALDFSICMPSNRPLAEARPSILSACAVLAQGNGELIISDNSRDEAKARWLASLAAEHHGQLHVIQAPDADAPTNWGNCLDRAQAPYIAALSDDDLLHFMGPVSFSRDADVVAIKPNIVVWSPEQGVTRVNNFPLMGATALERVQAYAQFAAGSNTTYYSFLKADVFRSVWKLGVTHHPTKGSYLDWAQVFAWVSSGRYVVEPNIVFMYCNRNWSGTTEALADRVKRQYTSAGLPERTVRFSALLLALDCFILIARQDSPVVPQERLEAALWALTTMLAPLLSQLAHVPDQFSTEEQRMLQRLALAGDGEMLLAGILRLLSHFDPVLAQGYINFYELAIGAPWGEFRASASVDAPFVS